MKPAEQKGPGFDARHPILLIAAQWRPRAYILAELQELGYEVRALPGIHFALGYLIRRPQVHPALVILDTEEDPDLTPERLEDMLAITEPAPWLVITSGTRPVPPVLARAAPRVHILKRPISIGQVVERARALLAGGDEIPA